MSTIKRSSKLGPGRVALQRVRRTTDKEIEAQIAADSETAPVSSEARWRKVYNPQLPDVKAIRLKLGMSQADFAREFGFSVRTIQDWEQGRSVPERAARILLRVIDVSPRTVERVLRAQRAR